MNGFLVGSVDLQYFWFQSDRWMVSSRCAICYIGRIGLLNVQCSIVVEKFSDRTKNSVLEPAGRILFFFFLPV